MDIPITRRTRALIVRYEHDRTVSEDAARDTLTQAGTDGHKDVTDVVLHPFDPKRLVRQQKAEEWATAFYENERFATALLQKEAELELDSLPVHLFGCAPLVLMLHLASCLQRRSLLVYQQAQDTGRWTLGYERGRAPSAEEFFQVEGLPTGQQGGRGHVALIVEVTNPIQEQALAEFHARYPGALLTSVRLRPAHGASPASVRHPEDVSRAVAQFRWVLDVVQQRLEGAESVLLAMDCPASFAAALGTAVNPNAQHPLWLYHFDRGQKSYQLVHRIHAQRGGSPAQATQPTREQLQDAMSVLSKVRSVHEELVAWLRGPEQQELVQLLGGMDLLESRVHEAPSLERAPVYRHLDGRWTFQVEHLLKLDELRKRLGSREDWEECVRLFFVHEAYHVRQGGPTSYSYSGSGRTGWVLEAVDYDADVLSFETALAWRMANGPASARAHAPARGLEAIIWNALELGRVFEPERPVRDLPERRLRRYLIWLFHACRLGTPAARRQPREQLERVTIELAGLRGYPDPYESYSQQRVSLEEFDKNESLSMAVYYRHRLARETNSAWVMELLKALGRWDTLPREKVQEAVKPLFEQFFERNRPLIEPREHNGAA